MYDMRWSQCGMVERKLDFSPDAVGALALPWPASNFGRF